MQKFLKILVVIILLICIVIFAKYFENKLYEQKFDSLPPCFVTAWGQKGGIDGGRVCECRGGLMKTRCPWGMSCDGTEFRCKGEIIDYTYIYLNQEFNTIEELGNHCNSLTDETTENSYITGTKTSCLQVFEHSKDLPY